MYLDVDSTQITAAAGLAMPNAAIAALAEVGVQVDSVTRVVPEIAEGHWIVHLHPGTSRERAHLGAGRLRLTEGFHFASNAYRVVGRTNEVMLINEFIARFKPGAAEADIARANSLTGAKVVRRTAGDSLRLVLSFPERSPHTPLEIVASYYKQPQVQYAEPNFFGNFIYP